MQRTEQKKRIGQNEQASKRKIKKSPKTQRKPNDIVKKKIQTHIHSIEGEIEKSKAENARVRETGEKGLYADNNNQ